MTSLVLLPGLDGTGALFSAFVEALPAECRVTKACYPTDKFLTYEELGEFVSALLPAQPYVIIAESFSSPLAVQLASRNPTNLRGLVLCAGFIANPMPRMASVAMIFASSAFFPAAPPEWVVRKYLVGNAPPDGLIGRLNQAIGSVKRDVLLGRSRALIEINARAALSETRIPLLYLQGSRDCVVGDESVREIFAVRKDARLEVIDAPHLVLQCAPRESAKAIVRFVNSLSG